MTAQPDSRRPVIVWLLGLIATVCVVWFLRAAAIVTIPLAAAFFIAIVIHPVQAFLTRRVPRPRWAALALTMALLVLIVGGAVWAIAESVDEAAEAAPQYSDRLQRLWRDLDQTARDYGLPVPRDVLAAGNVRDRAARFLTSVVGVAWSIASGLVLVFFLVLLMLIEAPSWSENTRRVLHGGQGRQAVALIGEIAEKVRKYLYVRTVLGFVSAVIAGGWLLLLDVDLVLVWVVLTFMLNYIPNIGSIIAVIPPSLMALLQHGPVYGLVTLGGLTVFEQVIGNFIDPRMQGRRLRISPAVVLAALLFWTWVWGPVGALLAVPMTVTLLAAAAQIPDLQPLAILLGHEDQAADEG